jgi:hypothetical protein
MKARTRLIIGAVLLVAFVLAWAPWITNDYAIDRVVEELGGPEARFTYLGVDMALKDVPKEVYWVPFGRFVTFPGEAGWFVTFYGSVP